MPIQVQAAGPLSSTPMEMRVRASVYVLVAFDVGQGIDLDVAERRLSAGAQRQGLGVGKRTPAYLDYRPLPVRVSGRAGQVEVRGAQGTGGNASAPQWKTEGTFDAVIYDFGAVSVTQRIAFEGTLEELLLLSDVLYEHVPALEEARRVLETVMGAIREAVLRPRVADVEECYVVFQLEDPRVAELVRHRNAETDGLIAGILRSERKRLSEEEIADALASRISYGERDAALIDWNAAIIVDPGEALPGAPGAGRGGEDVRFVLEYANVELLEMRVLDDRLDQILDESYRLVAERRTRLTGGWRGMNRIARLQMDSALLYEGVNNAIKLVGDQYLARVYRLAAKRFHLPERDSTIERKLSTLESIYSKLQDRRSAVRLEVLEWIVIVLIFVEVVMGVVAWKK
ncbi:MAG TPA: hypothetical protein VHC70_10180 [Phycisphaerales bacterium]|jgi:hypothetical protein|nr:hypothetical protein [Phycisphaerales bacterium]